jgi:hypothetical protein
MTYEKILTSQETRNPIKREPCLKKSKKKAWKTENLLKGTPDE